MRTTTPLVAAWCAWSVVVLGAAPGRQAAPAPPATSAQAASATTASADSSQAAPDDRYEYLVGPSDKLDVTVTPDPVPERRLTGLYTVRADGQVVVPLLSAPLKVANLTTDQIASRLRQALIDQHQLTNPQVVVAVAAYRSQNFTVNGFVTTPGEYSLAGEEMTLNRALNMAGNRRSDASDTIEVRHALKPGMGPDLDPNDPNVETKTYKWSDLQQGKDPRIYDGDYVYVPRAETFIVNGEVKSPGQQVWKPGMTIGRALDLVGGRTDKASLSRSYIRRMNPATKKFEKVDIKGLETPVEPDDTIVIMHTWW